MTISVNMEPISCRFFDFVFRLIGAWSILKCMFSFSQFWAQCLIGLISGSCRRTRQINYFGYDGYFFGEMAIAFDQPNFVKKIYQWRFKHLSAVAKIDSTQNCGTVVLLTGGRPSAHEPRCGCFSAPLHSKDRCGECPNSQSWRKEILKHRSCRVLW